MKFKYPVAIAFAATLFVGSTVGASAAGLRLLSHEQTCAMIVPADWKVNALLKSAATAPDNSMSAVISSGATDATLTLAKQVMESSYPPKQVFEDTPRRLLYEYSEDNGKLGIYTGVPGKHNDVCGAQITFAKGKEALAKQIALTVGPAS